MSERQNILKNTSNNTSKSICRPRGIYMGSWEQAPRSEGTHTWPGVRPISWTETKINRRRRFQTGTDTIVHYCAVVPRETENQNIFFMMGLLRSFPNLRKASLSSPCKQSTHRRRRITYKPPPNPSLLGDSPVQTMSLLLVCAPR